LRERSEAVPAVAAAVDPDALAGDPGEFPDHRRCDRILAGAVERGLGTLSVGLRLIAQRFKTLYAVPERGVVETGDTRLDRIVNPFEPQIGLGCASVQF
jgi:hypothetical protein